MKVIILVISGMLVAGIFASIWLINLGSFEPLAGCKSNEELNVYCDFKNPEDLALNHDHPITDSLKCSSNVNCTLPFSINQLSLQDLSLVASHEFESKNMGVGTVGLPHNGSFWIGSYRSDRLAEAKLSED